MNHSFAASWTWPEWIAIFEHVITSYFPSLAKFANYDAQLQTDSPSQNQDELELPSRMSEWILACLLLYHCIWQMCVNGERQKLAWSSARAAASLF